MADIADRCDNLVIDEIVNAVFEAFPTAAPPETGKTVRDAVMAALATDRARRERYQLPPSDARVLTAAETAKRLGLSRFTLLRMRQLPDADGLPFVQLSQGRIGYQLSDIEAYLAARRVGRLPEEDPEVARRRIMPRSSVRRQWNALPAALDRSSNSPR